MSVIQNLVVFLVFQKDTMKSALDQLGASATVPKFAALFINNLHLFVIFSLLFSIFLLVSSIGLLKRKSWGRKTMIGIFIFSIASMLAGLVIQNLTIGKIGGDFQGAVEQAKAIILFVRVFSWFITIATCALYAWLIKKLCSPLIVAEFETAP